MRSVVVVGAAIVLAGVAGEVRAQSAAGRGGALDALTVLQDARTRRVASNSPDPNSNADNRRVKPEETFTLAEMQGSGVVRHIWLTFAESAPSWLSKDGCADPSEIVLRMYWDGSSTPAVETPLGDFFAAGFGRRAEVNSLPVVVGGATGDAYNCYWAMPYRRGARITVTNESTKPLAALYYQIDYDEMKVGEDAAYFCAQYRQEFPTVRGRDYLICDAECEGGGHYVGTVMSVRSRSPQWFGEGDEKFYIDGEKDLSTASSVKPEPGAGPSMWGTGTEDYFSNAWGMEKACYPYFGVTQLDGWLGDLGDTGTMYRWHIADPVRFRKSLRLTIEHAGWMSADETSTGKVEGFVERDDDFATVAFWYQKSPTPKRFATLPSAQERRLPSIDRVIEGKTLLAGARSDGKGADGKGGGLSLQAGGSWTGEGQLFFDNQKAEGGWVECTFEVEKAWNGRVVLALTHSYDFGMAKVTLDGKSPAELAFKDPGGGGTDEGSAVLKGPVDLYSKNIEVKQHSLGDISLAAGKHTLRLECIGKNPASTGEKMGIDSLRLRERWNVKREPLKRK